jgi:rod shape-determining protein MreD
MSRTWFINLIAIILAALADIVFVGSLPLSLHSLHLVVLGIVFAALLANIRAAAWWALLGGLMFEIFSFRFFGSHLIILFLVLGLVYFLFERVMTNRSVYSLLMIAIGATILYDGLFLLFDYWSGVRLLPPSSLFKALGLSLVVNAVAAIFIFYISNLATRRLRPVFLPFTRR